MRIVHTLIICITLFHLSCRQKPSALLLKSEDFKEIIVRTDTGIALASRYFDSLQFVPLETRDECIIGRIKHIAFAKSNYIILDNLGDQILIFDSSGRFKNKVVITPPNSGAPRMKIDDFAVDEQTERLFLFNANSKTLYTYGFDGTFQMSRQFPFVFYSFEYQPEEKSFVCFTQTAPNQQVKDVALHNFIAADYTGNAKAKYGFINDCELKTHIGFLTEFSKYTGKVLVSPKLSDSFYSYKNGAFQLAYAFRIENHIASDYYCRCEAEEFYAKARYGKYSFIQKVLSTDKFLYYEYFKGQKIFVGFYDKASNENFNFKGISFDFPDLYTLRVPYPQFTAGNQFLSIYYPKNIVNNAAYIDAHITTYRKRMQDILRSAKTTDNPILVRYCMKS